MAGATHGARRFDVSAGVSGTPPYFARAGIFAAHPFSQSARKRVGHALHKMVRRYFSGDRRGRDAKSSILSVHSEAGGENRDWDRGGIRAPIGCSRRLRRGSRRGSRCSTDHRPGSNDERRPCRMRQPLMRRSKKAIWQNEMRCSSVECPPEASTSKYRCRK